MTTPQIVFWALTVILCVVLTIVMAPGVRRHAESSRDSWIAAFMASALFSTAVGFVVSSIVNAVLVAGG